VSLTRSLEQIRDSVRRAADVVAFTDRHTDASVNDLINRGLGALSRVCRTVNPEWLPIASTTITADGVNTSFALPSNFRSLISVEYTGEGHKTFLIPFEMHERAALTDPDVTSSATRSRYYKVVGTNLELLPRPPNAHTVLVWYATRATQLTSDSDTVDVMDRLDDFVIWWAAREIAMDRGDWERHDRLSAKIAEITAEVQILARSIDLSHPSRIVDKAHADRYWRVSRRGWRW